MRWLGAGLSVCCSLLGAMTALYLFAFASMVDPKLDALVARRLILEQLLYEPGAAIVAAGGLIFMLGGLAAFCLCLGKSHE